MIMKLKHALFILLLMIIPLQAGSYFTSQVKGVGIRQYNTGVRGLGMGGTGLASMDSLMLSSYALTQWRNIVDTRATFTFQYQRIYTDFEKASFTSSTADFAGVNIAIPLVKKKWVVGVTLQPYTQVDFKFSQQLEDNGQSFTQVNLYDGSVSKAQFVLVYSPVARVGIAVNWNYYFGTIQDRYELRYDDPNFLTTRHLVKYRISGPGGGISMDVRPFSALSLAGFVDTPANLNLSVSYDSPVNDPVNVERNLDGFPLQYGFGGEWRPISRLSLAADYSYQNWKKVLKIPDPVYEDWYRFGFGIERKMSQARSRKFLDRIDLRAGFSMEQIGYKFQGESVKEYSGHFGLGIPFHRMRNRIDLGLQAGIRGDKNKHQAQEFFYRFQISLAMGEQWFQRIR